MKKLLLSFIPFLLLFLSAKAQPVTLMQGDISIIGWNSSVNRGVSFVTWVALTEGTEIRFTDNGFNSASNSTSVGNVRWQETVLIWTANAPVSAGSVITIQDETTNTGTANVINSNGLDPSVTAIGFSNNGGDQVFAYQGLNMATTTTAATGNNQTFNNTILFGLGYRGNSANTTWLSTGTTGTATSYLPSDLISPNRIYHGGSGVTSGQYTGPRSGYTTAASYKLLIEDPTNWTNVTGLAAVVTYTTTSFAIGTPPSITSQPENVTICAGTGTSFSITASNATSYQWYVNTGSGFTLLSNTTPYSGVTTATLSISAATADMNNYTYRCIASGTASPAATSNTVTLTVNAAPAITASPSSATICGGLNTSFTATASNATGYQWYQNTGSGFAPLTNGGVFSGVTTSTLNITGATRAMSGYQYRMVATGACSPSVTSTAATLTVNAAPAITQNPFSSTICERDATLFYIAASNATGYQWQVNTGSGYTNLSNGTGPTGEIYSGANNAVMIVNNAALAMSGYTFRCIAIGSCTPNAVSSGVTLTVYANITYYEDYDNDGYGNPYVTTSSCAGVPAGFVANSADCDDNDSSIHPGAPEICNDGIDNDCDGLIDEDCVPLTQLSAADCGSTLEYLNTQYLTADPVIGAEQYEFRITSGAYTATAYDDLQAGRVRIIQFAGYQYGTTYQVAVRAKVAGHWGDFGSECTVTTTGAPHSEIDPAQCGTTLAALNTPIYTSTVNGATQYRFRIINGANVQTIDLPVRSFNFTQLASYEYNTTYTIDAAVEFDGVWSAYSSACNVTTPAIPTSKVLPSQCGITLGLISTNINAVPVAGATQYRFRITNGANVQTIDKPGTVFKLTELFEYAFSTTYTVDVAYEYNGVWQAYGSTCNVTTPAAPTTKLQASQCGITLPAMNTYLYADKVSGATAFRFRFTEGSNVQTIDNPTRAVNMTMLSTFKAGTTYAVEVAAQINGTWAAYGQVCNITTPGVPTQIKSNQCGITLTALNKLIYADVVNYATAYRFRVTNGANVQTIDRNTNSFYLIQLPSYAYGTTYTIDVAVQYAGIWQPYGSACNITTPAAGSVLTSLEPAVCGTQVTDNAQVIPAQKVTGATQYEFRVENIELSYSQSVVNNTFTFNFAQFTGLQSGTTYSVSVRTKVNNIWSDYGGECVVKTSGTALILGRNSRIQSISVAKTNVTEEHETDVNALNITNVITPNGDGKNDHWIIEKIDQYPNNSVKIVNKAGKVVFTAKGYNNSWNATVNGMPLDEGTYYYLIDFGKNNLTRKGYITIVREGIK